LASTGGSVLARAEGAAVQASADLRTNITTITECIEQVADTDGPALVVPLLNVAALVRSALAIAPPRWRNNRDSRGVWVATLYADILAAALQNAKAAERAAERALRVRFHLLAPEVKCPRCGGDVV
jgi:hypothetical protein